MSKILEKVVLAQLSSFLSENNVLDNFQFGFRVHHSTETALLKVLNDLLLFGDGGNCAILLLLDLSAAFDTVDHAILSDCLQHRAGIQAIALQWFNSYLKNITFFVGNISSSAAITCSVPQGSILGPILFSLYMLPLGSILHKHSLSRLC